MAYQVIFEPGIGQFREFETPRVHSNKFVGDFSCAQIDFRKAREHELATLDQNRRAVGLLNPMRDKSEGKSRGVEGTTPVTTACPEAGKYNCEKKNK